MKDILRLYEQAEVIDILLNTNGHKTLEYVSPTSIHSDVTTWAYGDYLKRKCIELVAGVSVVGNFVCNDNCKRKFLKIIACLPDWQKYINSLKVVLNGKTVYDNERTFFEQVNLGWPAVYIELPKNSVLCGENTIELSTTNSSGAGLYISEVSIVAYPLAENLTQVSCIRYAVKDKRFGVAVKDENCDFVSIEKVANCVLEKTERYKDLRIFSFTAKAENMQATAIFKGREVCLKMPKTVADNNGFLFGMDSDDHRHDYSSETYAVIENSVFSGIGNYIQFRPQYMRNYYDLMEREGFEKFINLFELFGIKYGLVDNRIVMRYLPDINPNLFFGYHIHEPYLFYNPELAKTEEGRQEWLCDPEKMVSSQSFGESREMYRQVLKQSKNKFSTGVGLTSFGSPSMLCVYEGDTDIDRITIEPVSNLNLLAGTVRATTVKMWGAHIPTDWYFGIPVDKVKSNKYRLAMQYLYLNGASYLYAENSLFVTNAYERCDWESEFCRQNREYCRDMYDYVLQNSRKGNLLVDKAIVYGRNDFFMWKLDDRIAELKEKDWDSYVWGKWDNAYHASWNACEAWLPLSDKQNVFENPVNKNLFSGTPYGNIDVVGAEKDFSKYNTIAFLGWNTMDQALFEKLKAFVKDGGTLVISYAHFNTTDRNDMPFVYLSSQEIQDFIGVEITDLVDCKEVQFNDGKKFNLNQSIEIATGNALTAESLATDGENTIVYKNKYGKGQVYFVAYADYTKNIADTAVMKYLLEKVGESGNSLCDNKNVSFTVREASDKYYIHVLNMNCLPNATEEFNITYKGKNISGEIAVGEIKEFEISK